MDRIDDRELACGLRSPELSTRKVRSPLPTRHPTHWPRQRRSLPATVAAALLLGLASFGVTQAQAATLVVNTGTEAEGVHGHDCKCRMHCKTACCCAPDKHPTATTPGRTSRAEVRHRGEAGPCFQGVPCDAPESPSASPVVRVFLTALRAVEAAMPTPMAGVRVVSLPSAIAPAAPLSRIDEPPEPRATA